MAIRISNIEYLSYEEQVLKNKSDIEILKGEGIILDDRAMVRTTKPNQIITFNPTKLPTYAKMYLEILTTVNNVQTLVTKDLEFPVLDALESGLYRLATAIDWQGQVEIIVLEFIATDYGAFAPKITITGNTQYNYVRLVLSR